MTQQIKIAGLIVAFALMLSAVTNGQEQDADKPYLTVYYLGHIENELAHRVTQSFFAGQDDVRMEPDQRFNSLIFFAKRAQHEEMSTLLKTLDKPQEQSAIMVFALKHRSAQEIQSLLTHITGNSGSWPTLRIACDKESNSLVVTGSQRELKKFTGLVESIDRPFNEKTPSSEPENCTIRITWLVDSEGFDPNEFQKPDSRLNELAQGLVAEGIMKRPIVMTRYQTSVSPAAANSKETNSFTGETLRYANEDPVAHYMMVEGGLKTGKDEKYNLDLSVKMRIEPTSANLSSSIVLPKDHPVAFSMLDIGGTKCVAVVEIIGATKK